MFLFAVSLASFSAKPGGEGFEIFLDQQLVIQQFGNMTAPALPLGDRTTGSKLFIKYHHCGKTGKDRVITIKDENNKVRKVYHFPDSPSSASVMALELKEIKQLKTAMTASLQLYYASSELPAGRQLARIEL